MYTLIGIIFIGIGLTMLISPKTFFEITESWKSNISDEPSELYIFSTRFGDYIYTILGIASIIFW